ncbi:MAG: biotin-dependent carboxyltransferase family protein [Austwickia sp.]|nr:biotin-dependent carboxyltransferase family protein [Austwickia sp.]MCO5310825.1 biotin-dependent carboxyltransferase family protein [Austwickia sp.]
MSLRVIAPGARTLIEDLGRPGLAALGVSPSGAADGGAHRLANRLLGNPESAATLEVLAGGLVLEAQAATVVAVTGAPVGVRIGGIPAPFAAPVFVGAGQRLELARPEAGVRSYVAVLGGIDVEPVLGSRSSDTIAGLGPAPLAAGDVLRCCPALISAVDTHLPGFALGPAGESAADLAGALFQAPLWGQVRLTGTWGPRADWFAPEARALLTATAWDVGPDSDRVGVRCQGPRLDRPVEGELASEATVRGSVQVPPSGQPVIFLADHPTTGGYPVIAVLDGSAVDRVAQVRPGDVVRFDIRPPAYPCDLSLHWPDE